MDLGIVVLNRVRFRELLFVFRYRWDLGFIIESVEREYRKG